MIWHIYRILINENSTDKISDDLVVGRRLLPKEVREEYEGYIDLTAEFDEPRAIRDKSSYICFPILDASVPNIEKLMDLLEKVENKNLYIHCAQGHGRTGLVALALLLRKGIIKDVREGVDYLKSFRPALNLNNYQIEYLEKNKDRITNRPS